MRIQPEELVLPFVDDRRTCRLPPRERARIGAERLSDPLSGSICDKVRAMSPVPGGMSMIK